MAKWETLESCPSCGDKEQIKGTELEWSCGKCGRKYTAGEEGPAAPMMPRGCPGCGGRVKVLPREKRIELGKLACCQDCGREPIEYARLGAVMTERDQFAAAALAGLLAKVAYVVDPDALPEYKAKEKMIGEMVAKASYELADAMLAEREKGGKDG